MGKRIMRLIFATYISYLPRERTDYPDMLGITSGMCGRS